MRRQPREEGWWPRQEPGLVPESWCLQQQGRVSSLCLGEANPRELLRSSGVWLCCACGMALYVRCSSRQEGNRTAGL